MKITASHLYSYIQCPHRIWRDIYGPQHEKSKEDNAFLQMLWEKGVAHEKKIIDLLDEFVDISKFPISKRKEETIKAIKGKARHIYQGVIAYDDLYGIPDLLELQGDGFYMPVDIKSGIGYEETDLGDAKLKKPYAVQLALYVEILNKLGVQSSKDACVWNINADRILYQLEQPQGARTPQTYWELYEETKNSVRLLMQNKKQNKPVIAATCKVCHWYESCKNWCIDNDDLTRVFYLGRTKRDVFNQELGVFSVEDLAKQDVVEILAIKKERKGALPGIGETNLPKFLRRAKLLQDDGLPVLYEMVAFPKVDYELYFDIETDPTQDIVYLHGFYERNLITNETRFVSFVAESISDAAESTAWAQAIEYIQSFSEDNMAMYYYSAYEKTMYRHLQEKYPEIITGRDLDKLFARENVIDLYTNVVFKKTDWPLSSYSIKEIAVYLGFAWRDESPSGALSIKWYNDYCQARDGKLLQRILDYNEDDCIATMIVKDGIENMQKNKS